MLYGKTVLIDTYEKRVCLCFVTREQQMSSVPGPSTVVRSDNFCNFKQYYFLESKIICTFNFLCKRDFLAT